MYSIFGSDAHSNRNRNTDISEAISGVLRDYKCEFGKNGQLILEDKEIIRKLALIKERK